MTDIFTTTDAADAPKRRTLRKKGKRQSEPDRPPRHPLVNFLRDVGIVVVSAIVISFLIKTFLIRSFFIPSSSMEDTLLVNDRIIVNQLVPDLVPISRGDIVVFQDPGGWLPVAVPPERGEQPNPLQQGWDAFLHLVGLSVSDSNDHLIKRVIGLPGDNVVCCTTEGQLSINGEAIDEPYLKIPEGDPASGVVFDVTVPENSLWVMGDNRYDSIDSRAHQDEPGGGFVPMKNVVGRAIVITWPFDRWRWLDNHGEVFAEVPESD